MVTLDQPYISIYEEDLNYIETGKVLFSGYNVAKTILYIAEGSVSNFVNIS